MLIIPQSLIIPVWLVIDDLFLKDFLFAALDEEKERRILLSDENALFFNEKVYPKSPFSTENPKNAWKNVKFPGKTLLSRKKTVTTLPIHFWDYVYKNEK